MDCKVTLADIETKETSMRRLDSIDNLERLLIGDLRKNPIISVNKQKQLIKQVVFDCQSDSGSAADTESEWSAQRSEKSVQPTATYRPLLTPEFKAGAVDLDKLKELAKGGQHLKAAKVIFLYLFRDQAKPTSEINRELVDYPDFKTGLNSIYHLLYKGATVEKALSDMRDKKKFKTLEPELKQAFLKKFRLTPFP